MQQTILLLHGITHIYIFEKHLWALTVIALRQNKNINERNV